MAVNERDRYRLFEAVQQQLGVDVADTLMQLLPPVGWADVALKRDLDQMELLLRSDLDRTRTELSAALKLEVSGLRAEMHREFGAVRAEMHREFGAVRAEMGGLRAEMHQELGRVSQRIGEQTRTLVLTMMTMQLATIGATVAAIARFA